MEERKIIELVEAFIKLCDDLLLNGKISEDIYIECTRNKKEFLKNIS
ncbi:hypothetical protein [Crassaminicella thermophila]|nr:hypothetical protein [Crassaminicella thermophila]